MNFCNCPDCRTPNCPNATYQAEKIGIGSVANSIGLSYSGATDEWSASMLGAGVLFSSTNKREVDMFVAELKARLLANLPKGRG